MFQVQLSINLHINCVIIKAKYVIPQITVINIQKCENFGLFLRQTAISATMRAKGNAAKVLLSGTMHILSHSISKYEANFLMHVEYSIPTYSSSVLYHPGKTH